MRRRLLTALTILSLGAVGVTKLGSAQAGGPLERVRASAEPVTAKLQQVRGPALSGDGRYVAFATAASLLSDDTNQASDVYLYDRQSAQLLRVSTAPDGAQTNGPSLNPALSADGRLVAFESRASNLVPGDTNRAVDIFVKNLQSGAIERVSQSASSGQANGTSGGAVLSADGQLVAFWSEASTLVPDDTNSTYENGGYDIFVKDRQSGAIERVSVGPDGAEGRADSLSPALSGDGRFVVFGSYAPNLTDDDQNGLPDIFLKDRQTGQMELVSRTADGAPSDGSSFWTPTLSADARFVAFASEATNLAPGDANGVLDVFVKDRQSGTVERISSAAAGSAGNGPSYAPAISADGRFVAFASEASDLVAGDANGAVDVFLHDRQTGRVERLSSSADGLGGDGPSYGPAMTLDGAHLAFWSVASNLSAGDNDRKANVFLLER
jgi:Tol biopolymer transport system component